jgi:hypothetical protein
MFSKKEIQKLKFISKNEPFLKYRDELDSFYKSNPITGLGFKNKWWLKRHDDKLNQARKDLEQEHQLKINSLLADAIKEHIDYIREHYGE